MHAPIEKREGGRDLEASVVRADIVQLPSCVDLLRDLICESVGTAQQGPHRKRAKQFSTPAKHTH
eukprot:COSAG05_NODE_5889_length_1065_cov_2.250518_1_plen_64_part_01